MFFDELFEIFALPGVQEEEHAGDFFVQSRHVRRHLPQDTLCFIAPCSPSPHTRDTVTHRHVRTRTTECGQTHATDNTTHHTVAKQPLAAVAKESGAAASPLRTGACANRTATVDTFLRVCTQS